MQALLDVSTADADLADVDAEQMIDAVADDRRRHALRVLAEDDPELALSTLTTRVHRIETDGGEDLDSRDVKLSLHHSDLPKLDALGFVSYDPDEREVELDVDPDAMELRGALVE